MFEFRGDKVWPLRVFLWFGVGVDAYVDENELLFAEIPGLVAEAVGEGVSINHLDEFLLFVIYDRRVGGGWW